MTQTSTTAPPVPQQRRVPPHVAKVDTVPGEDPSVTTWRLLMAPRPRFSTGGKHWWRDMVTDAFHSAHHAWWLDREAVALGYATEMAEYEAQHPQPRLGDFMPHLSSGGIDPERLQPA